MGVSDVSTPHQHGGTDAPECTTCVTESDDLARLIREHRLVGSTIYDAACACGDTSDHTTHLTFVLSSRDAELRAGVERELRKAWNCNHWKRPVFADTDGKEEVSDG